MIWSEAKKRIRKTPAISADHVNIDRQGDLFQRKWEMFDEMKGSMAAPLFSCKEDKE